MDYDYVVLNRALCRRRLEGLKQGIEKRKEEPVKSATPKKWSFW